MDQSLDQKEQILAQAINQYFQLGIKSVSMDDISSTMGISKKTLYQYFESKTDLVNSAMSAYVQQEEEDIRAIIRHSTNALIEMVSLARCNIKHMRKITPTLIHDLQKYYSETWTTLMGLHMEFFKSVIETNLERGKAEGLYRADLDTDIIAKLYVSKSFSLVDEGLFSLQNYQREYLLRQHVIYHIYGILSSKGIQHFQSSQLFKD